MPAISLGFDQLVRLGVWGWKVFERIHTFLELEISK